MLPALLFIAAGAFLGVLANRILFGALRRGSELAGGELGRHLSVRLKAPARLLFAVIGAGLAFSAYSPELTEAASSVVGHLLRVGWIVSAAWLAVRVFLAAEDALLAKYDMTKADNLRARAIHTQVQVFNRIFTVLAVILTLGAILMSIDEFRRLGTSLLASAGLAGIVVGLAAQKTIGNVLAGIQIAFTQPIRLDDVVVVEGEWGWIEEITFTYVVVRVWDKRRLVLPVSYFLEKPFQNWTKTSADILGTVFVYADWTLPVAEFRAEAERLIKGHKLWDGKAAGVQVTNASERGVELRALMSAASSPDLWNLRCDVREGLIAWLQAEHPECLPRTRAELDHKGGKDFSPGGPGLDQTSGSADNSAK